MDHRFYKKKKNGFTLSELLISVTILAILALAALIGINPLLQIFKGYDARRKADLYAIKNAFEAYFTDHDCYPPSDILNRCGSSDLDPYLKKIPCDPQDGSPYELTLVPSDVACPQQYAIYSKLMNPTDPQANAYPPCPETMVVASTNMTYADIIAGCSSVSLCPVYYGCKSGLCAAVARDKDPTCAPNYCDPDCGGVNCARQVRRRFVNECVAI